MCENTKKLLSLFGLCRRAGRLSAGFQAITDAMSAGEARAVFAAADISAKTFKELVFRAGKIDIPVFRLKIDSSELTAAVGFKTGTVSINDEGFANAAKDYWEETGL